MNILHLPSHIIHHPSSIILQPSSLILQPSSFSHLPSSIIPQPSSLFTLLSSLFTLPSAIICHSPVPVAPTCAVLHRLGFQWSDTAWDYVERLLIAISGFGFFDENRFE